MKQNYSDEVIYLSSQTGISKKRCKIVLEECGGDMNFAIERLEILADNKYDKAMDNISALISGERGSIISVSEGGDTIFRLPCFIAVLLLFVIDIPGWVIGILLLLFVVFGMEINISFTEKDRKANFRTVSVEEYRKKQSISKKIAAGRKKVRGSSKDGYNEIIIEE